MIEHCILSLQLFWSHRLACKAAFIRVTIRSFEDANLLERDPRWW